MQSGATIPSAPAAVTVPAGVVYVQPVPVTTTNRMEHYPENQSVGFGAAQIVLGILCIIFNTIDLLSGFGVAVIGHGIWCGILFIIAGAFGIAAGKRKSNCKIVAYMVLCIISAGATIPLFIIGVVGAVLSDIRCSFYYYHRETYPSYDPSPMYCSKVPMAMETCLAVAALIGAVLSIWGSVLVCKAGQCNCCLPAMQPPAPIPLVYFQNTGKVLQGAPAPLSTMPVYQGAPTHLQTIPVQQGVQASFPTMPVYQIAPTHPQMISAQPGDSTDFKMLSPPPYQVGNVQSHLSQDSVTSGFQPVSYPPPVDAEFTVTSNTDVECLLEKDE